MHHTDISPIFEDVARVWVNTHMQGRSQLQLQRAERMLFRHLQLSAAYQSNK